MNVVSTQRTSRAQFTHGGTGCFASNLEESHMRAYHNDPAVKAKYEARFAAHRAADEVIQGQGFDNGRGCFVGCTLDDYDHSRFPEELGWPEWLARLADTIFERLPDEDAPQFGTDLLAAVNPGVDLELARIPFLVAVQQRNLARLQDNNEPYAAQCRDALT
jgi:hypothetical protein